MYNAAVQLALLEHYLSLCLLSPHRQMCLADVCVGRPKGSSVEGTPLGSLVQLDGPPNRPDLAGDSRVFHDLEGHHPQAPVSIIGF